MLYVISGSWTSAERNGILSYLQEYRYSVSPLSGITCLFIASKVEEIYPPKISDFTYVTDGACTDDDILQNEIVILRVSQTSCWIYMNGETLTKAWSFKFNMPLRFPSVILNQTYILAKKINSKPNLYNIFIIHVFISIQSQKCS